MLKIENVTSGYGNKIMVNNVSLKVERGQFVSIIGPNGAGKSTLLKTIMGIVPLSDGRITLEGEEIMGFTPDVLVRKGLGYVPQGRVVFPNLTVEENVRMGGYTLSKKELNQRLKDVFTLFPHVEYRRSMLAGLLSGGEQQQVSIARSLMMRPKVLLLDEPSLGLAPKMMQLLFAKLVELNAVGLTIVLVEQNAHQAVKVATRVVVLENGKVIMDGGQEVMNSSRIKELYLGH